MKVDQVLMHVMRARWPECELRDLNLRSNRSTHAAHVGLSHDVSQGHNVQTGDIITLVFLLLYVFV